MNNDIRELDIIMLVSILLAKKFDPFSQKRFEMYHNINMQVCGEGKTPHRLCKPQHVQRGGCQGPGGHGSSPGWQALPVTPCHSPSPGFQEWECPHGKSPFE